jgi:FkbM family methyltransferase
VKFVSKSVSATVIKSMPQSTLARFEHFFRMGQGKGWGSSTVEQEVLAALSLITTDNYKSVVALDVGANVGRWTSAFLTAVPNAEVYAFEPSATAFDSLQKALGEDQRVHLTRTALGAEVGMGTLFADNAGSGLASLTKRKLDHFDINFDYSEEVAITTLDEWFAAQPPMTGGAPLILKMDVEGHELDVLRGAETTLQNINVVQFEFGGCNIDTRTYFQDFYYYFKSAGFRIFRLGPKGLEHVARYTENDEAFTTTNYFAQRE